jgi:hypothetical protein
MVCGGGGLNKYQSHAADSLRSRLMRPDRRQRRQGKNQEKIPRQGTEGDSIQTRMAVALLFLAAQWLAASAEANITALNIHSVAPLR